MSDDAMAKLKEMMEKQEELHPALKPWLEESEHFGQALKHPLVFSIPHFDQMNAQMNHVLERKTEMLDEYREEKKWHSYVFTYERPYRLYAFERLLDELEDDGGLADETYWDILGGIWTDSENIWQNEEEWTEYLSAERPSREHLMDEDERKAFAKLPDEIEIHRGYKLKERKLGMSWTLAKPMAEWFARRLIRDGERAYVVTATVPKDKVLAYFLGRGETEIVTFPDDVTVTKTTRVAAMRGNDRQPVNEAA